MENSGRERMPASGFGSERQLREVLDSLIPSVFIGLLTVEGILTYANRAALEAVGAKLGDVLGKPFDATPWWSFSVKHGRKPSSCWRLVDGKRSPGPAFAHRCRVGVGGISGTLESSERVMRCHNVRSESSSYIQ